MGTNVSSPAPVRKPGPSVLGRVRLILALSLSIILLLCLGFAWETRDVMSHLSFLRDAGDRGVLSSTQDTLVDLSPWQTAEALAPLAVTTEERNHAREAERLADHEVDQAFAAALREATLRQHKLTGDAAGLAQKVAGLQQVVKQDQEHVRSLTPAAGKPAADTGAIADDLDVAKAQLGLDSDELADAEEDLARASGDQRGQIQQELSAHEAAMKKYDSGASDKGQVAVLSAKRYSTVAGQIGAWFDQDTRRHLILEAQKQAQESAAALTGKHNTKKTTADGKATAAANTPPLAQDKTAKIESLTRRAEQRQILTIYDDRIETERQLAAVYGKWAEQVQLQHRILLHLLLRSFALLAFILLAIVLLNWAVRHWVLRASLDRRRIQTLRTIFELGIQVTGLIIVLLVIFGVPNQMPTILGLATAGITVVMQDYILAFFGWFLLMGKNGIRVGDWVEINGVGGEIVDIGVFKTTILETGNWTGKGHPTGRRARFTNSFAVNGQFFNFSTAGQWMWDEIRVGIPSTGNTTEMLEQIVKAVTIETEKETEVAEEEWKQANQQNGLSQFPARPSVNLRPSAAGIDVIVRFVTRAADRFDVRNRVYERVIEVTRKPQPVA